MNTQDVKEDVIVESPEEGNEQEPGVEISESERTILELKDQLLRALAETENTRRRGQKEKEDALKFGVTNIAKDMVSVADNLRRALENKQENAAELAEALFSGVDLILKDLEGILGRHGIMRIEASGQQFDPHWHQAVFEQETDEHAPGVIVQVIQDGYKIHDRLLRPAMVGVAKPKSQSVA